MAIVKKTRNTECTVPLSVASKAKFKFPRFGKIASECPPAAVLHLLSGFPPSLCSKNEKVLFSCLLTHAFKTIYVIFSVLLLDFSGNVNTLDLCKRSLFLFVRLGSFFLLLFLFPGLMAPVRVTFSVIFVLSLCLSNCSISSSVSSP